MGQDIYRSSNFYIIDYHYHYQGYSSIYTYLRSAYPLRPLYEQLLTLHHPSDSISSSSQETVPESDSIHAVYERILIHPTLLFRLPILPTLFTLPQRYSTSRPAKNIPPFFYPTDLLLHHRWLRRPLPICALQFPPPIRVRPSIHQILPPRNKPPIRPPILRLTPLRDLVVPERISGAEHGVFAPADVDLCAIVVLAALLERKGVKDCVLD